MAALTGTLIVDLARLYAQDTSTVNPGISDAQALLTLNDVLMAYKDSVANKHQLVPASATGLTFAPGDTSKVTSSTDIQAVISAHPSTTNTANAAIAPAIDTATLQEVSDLLDARSDGTAASQSGEWQLVAWEPKAGSPPGTWTFYVYPALNTTMYMHLTAQKFSTIAALANTPDVDEREARDIARLCAWLWCPLLGRDASFASDVLRFVSPDMLERVRGLAGISDQVPARIREVNS